MEAAEAQLAESSAVWRRQQEVKVISGKPSWQQHLAIDPGIPEPSAPLVKPGICGSSSGTVPTDVAFRIPYLTNPLRCRCSSRFIPISSEPKEPERMLTRKDPLSLARLLPSGSIEAMFYLRTSSVGARSAGILVSSYRHIALFAFVLLRSSRALVIAMPSMAGLICLCPRGGGRGLDPHASQLATSSSGAECEVLC